MPGLRCGLPPRKCCLHISGDAPISHGWRVGKRITCESNRRGTVLDWPAGWNSECHLSSSLGGQWWIGEPCSECQLSDGCQRAVSYPSITVLSSRSGSAFPSGFIGTAMARMSMRTSDSPRLSRQSQMPNGCSPASARLVNFISAYLRDRMLFPSQFCFCESYS